MGGFLKAWCNGSMTDSKPVGKGSSPLAFVEINIKRREIMDQCYVSMKPKLKYKLANKILLPYIMFIYNYVNEEYGWKLFDNYVTDLEENIESYFKYEIKYKTEYDS